MPSSGSVLIFLAQNGLDMLDSDRACLNTAATVFQTYAKAVTPARK